MIAALRPLRPALAAALVLAGPSCTYEKVESPPPVNLSPEDFSPPAPAAPPGGTLGLSVEAHESDSLEKLERLPGVRVSSAAPGGPAALAGIAAGDVVLAVDGAPVDGPDGFEAAARAVAPGRTARLEVRRDTTVFEARVVAGPAAAGAPPAELYRADPVKLRAGFRTVLVGEGDGRRAAAELVRAFPRSPLVPAGLAAGDRVVGIGGVRVTSAQDLVRKVAEDHGYGERVTLDLLREGQEVPVPVTLWEPERRLTRLAVPILFDFERTLRPRSTRWSVLDFWLFSVFSWRRDEGEREVRLLSLFKFRTGYGELVEEPREGSQGK